MNKHAQLGSVRLVRGFRRIRDMGIMDRMSMPGVFDALTALAPFCISMLPAQWQANSWLLQSYCCLCLTWLAGCLSIRLSVCGLWQVPKQNRKILFLSAGVPFGQRVLYLLASSWAQFNWILFRFFFFFLCGIRVTPLAACCSLFFTSLPFFLCSFCCPTVCFLIAGQQFQFFFFAGAFLLTCRRFAAVFSC